MEEDILEFTLERFRKKEVRQSQLLALLKEDLENISELYTTEQVAFLNQKYNIELNLVTFRSWYRRRNSKKSTKVKTIKKTETSKKVKSPAPAEEKADPKKTETKSKNMDVLDGMLGITKIKK